MARIRTIKPEFPHSESVGALSRDARLLFIQLWTVVDDDGRSRAASRMLASLLYPYDDDAGTLIDGWLKELETSGMIQRYSASGSQYLQICKWRDHQKIDHPSKSRLPAPEDGLANPREDSRSLAPDLVPSTLDLVSRTSAAAKAPAAPKAEKVSKRKPKVSIAEGFTFSDGVKAYAKSLGFKDGEIAWQQTRFIRHAKENDRKCADWDMAAENWFDKALEFAGKSPPAPAQPAVDDGFIEVTDEEALAAWDAYAMKKSGKSWPRNSRGGWRFPAQWPPGYVKPEPAEYQPLPPPRMQTIQ